MDQPSKSIAPGNSHPPPLPSLIDYPPPRPKYIHSGERIFRNEPEKYRLCVDMLANPANTFNSVCRTTKLSEHTVIAIRERERVPIERQRQRIALKVARTLERAVERVEEKIGASPIQSAINAVATLTDRLQTLTGDDVKKSINLNLTEVNLLDQFQKLHEHKKGKITLLQ